MVGFSPAVRNGASASQAQTSLLLSLHSGISLTAPCHVSSHFTAISFLALAVLNLRPPSATPSPMLSGSSAVLNLPPPSATPSPMLSDSPLFDPFPLLQLFGPVFPHWFWRLNGVSFTRESTLLPCVDYHSG
ncbi:hypothetical protein Nepgr_003892 [Nepenthes gracilis]|uniref:Uncharacterized protein n=1 Tax=Nepenthes gracilis TaxID=150966 RepID=A0AAD3XEC4_NEPGR|nr:hypothetical protein Nepgr_003892 [Nepenthes gracilis]